MNAAIAKAPAREVESTAGKFLTFILGSECFGANLAQIREIIEFRPLAAVHRVPEYIRGMLNLRGAVVPVVDLARRFGSAAEGQTAARSCIIIVEAVDERDGAGAMHKVGVIVDAVSAVVDIAADAMEPAPEFGTHICAEYLRGATRIKERFVLILDLNRVIAEMALQAGEGAPQH